MAPQAARSCRRSACPTGTAAAALAAAALACCGPRPAAAAVPQVALPLVERMPGRPQPWAPTDWPAVASAWVGFVFDAVQRGEHLPLLWWDDAHRNFNQTTFGVPSYVGGATGGGAAHEAIAGAGAVLTGFLAGANMTCLTGPGFHCVDFERMLLNYFDADGAHVWTNSPDGGSRGEFWYQVWSSMVPLMVTTAGGRAGALAPWALVAALTWVDVMEALGGSAAALPDFNWTGVDFTPGRPPAGYSNGDFTQPVASAGLGFLSYVARALAGEDTPTGARLLTGARWALDYLEGVQYDPYWEVLLPHGAYAAARMNAELGTAYNVSRLLNWVLQDDATPPRAPFRYGWGTVCDAWGGVDVHGLIGSVTDRGGYAFAMDTSVAVAALLPIARYDASFARGLGKWAATAANAARLFLPSAAGGPDAQSDWPWVAAAPAGARALAYEGVRKWGFNASATNITGPYATGDAKAAGRPTNLAVYGGAYVGLLAAVVRQTDAPFVTRFELNAVDYAARPAHPTSLVFNPGPAPAAVTLPLPGGGSGGPFDVYDAVAQAVIARRALGAAGARVTVAADAAAVLVAYPSAAPLTYDAATRRLSAGGVVIDWHVDGLPGCCG